MRRRSIPIIYVSGNHYEIGFDVGRTFKSMIQIYLNIHEPLNKVYLPIYQTNEGKNSFDETLKAVTKNFPQYIEEMKGIADGANVPFYKLFILHMDEILSCSVKNNTTENVTGCSTIYSNYRDQLILGHNEDALAETLNNFYIVSAHIKSDKPMGRWKIKEEKFTSLCYPGMLPGFTMSYNYHGFLYTVNVIRVLNMQTGKTPRTIITRALLAAENLSQVKEILDDVGTGIGDALSLNMIFLKEDQKLFFNAEVAPSEFTRKNSLVNIISTETGKHFYHCNKYLRLTEPESQSLLMISSKRRHLAMDSLPVPQCCTDVCNVLGDTSDKEFPIFRDDEKVKTIATGIFNINKMIWSIFTENPKNSDPVCELPILIESNKSQKNR